MRGGRGQIVEGDRSIACAVERAAGVLGPVGNDADAGGGRPSALYLATNIDDTGGVESTWDGAGWVEVVYGVSGNVTSFTVHGECHDVSSGSCVDDTSDTVEDRRDGLRTNCTCADEQHYSFRWDELNRLVDGRRYDRESGDWVPAARMRYRYDGANQRTVKQTFAEGAPNTEERVALYIYPGDFERRGLLRDTDRYTAIVEDEVDDSETQYMVAGARIVWAADPDGLTPDIDNNRRATINVTDLLGTTGAVVDLESGDLVEVSTYYPSGARENLWTNDALTPIEPSGFTGKEADEEIGMTYFGERWLIPRLGRWATPDPLHVHASGGGQTGNAYHYVGGNLLQAVDPLGLSYKTSDTTYSSTDGSNSSTITAQTQTDQQYQDLTASVPTSEQNYYSRGTNSIDATETGVAAWRAHKEALAAGRASPLSEQSQVYLGLILSDVVTEYHPIDLDTAPGWLRAALTQQRPGTQESPTDSIYASFGDGRARIGLQLGFSGAPLGASEAGEDGRSVQQRGHGAWTVGQSLLPWDLAQKEYAVVEGEGAALGMDMDAVRGHSLRRMQLGISTDDSCYLFYLRSDGRVASDSGPMTRSSSAGTSTHEGGHIARALGLAGPNRPSMHDGNGPMDTWLRQLQAGAVQNAEQP